MIEQIGEDIYNNSRRIPIALFLVSVPISVAGIAVRLNGPDRIACVADEFVARLAIGIAVLTSKIVTENAIAVGNKTDGSFLTAHSACSGASLC